MKKMSLFVAAAVLCLSNAAFAETKIDTAEHCCREGDANCPETEAYTPSCLDDKTGGSFCSTDKNDKDGDGSKEDRVVWQITCAEDETCYNDNGNISCKTATCADYPKCEGNVGSWCNSKGEIQSKTCVDGTKCNVSDTGYVDCIVDDPSVPTGECTIDETNNPAGCNAAKTIGWYCKVSSGATTGEYATKTCTGSYICQVSTTTNNSVSCVNPDAPTGECDPKTVNGQCSADGKTGYYCKADGSGWNSKTCSNADCVVNESVNSVSCGSGGSGETGECTSADGYCDATDKLLGHRCVNGKYVDWNCQEGQKCQEGYKEDGTASPGWLLCVDDDGTDPDNPGVCTARCSSDGAIAYNCANGAETTTVCLSGTSCKMNGTTAECAAKLDNGSGSGDKDDDDSGCSATGAGFLFGWMGLALLPGLRRRQK